MKTLLNLLAFTLLSVSAFSQKIDQQFFQDTDTFLKANVENGLVNYSKVKNSAALKSLISTVENADLTAADDATKKAFYINAYNLHVINAAVTAFPIQSVQEIPGFFDRKKVKVANKVSTLNNLEKDNLLKPYQDGRLHFVLVCGALDCPPITSFAYLPEKLDMQLDQQTKKALDNPNFLKAKGTNIDLSQIFKWYPNDFGGSRINILAFINKHRTYAVPTTAKISYYDYDWTLNDVDVATQVSQSDNSQGNNASRYIVSSTIPKGSAEIKIFNNLYTQKTGGTDNLTDRSTFFTTTLTALYGLTDRFNIGINTRYRRVNNARLPSSALNVLSSLEQGSGRQGLTAFGPQIRYAPVEKWSNFSIQSSFVFPIGEDLAGSSTQPYIDWTGATWWTQLFNDIPIGNNFSLFTELDFLIEDIGKSEEGHINRFSTPATLILSYNPNPKTTIYTIGGFSPYWQTNFDYFLQGGVGAKYQFTPDLELELLVTDFTNKFLRDTGGQAATFNVGFRFNL